MIDILSSLIEIINNELKNLDIKFKLNKDSIFIGPKSELESIIIVSILASIEDELNLRYSINTDLFELINNLDFDNITIENIASELIKYHES